MLLHVYFVSLVATLTAVSSQVGLLPSSILCAPGQGPAITRDDCKKALSKFSSESNVIFYSGDVYSHSCGTCKLAITKPSLPNSVHHSGVFSYVLTALHEGIDKCEGKPTNATIGNFQPISVLLDHGAGEKC
ncbi:hypothetical protein MJO28_008540 [Puccinia striiformis f. sp. tritici]|uniref:Secreted protein n=2 Tax=Puccinia striiformis TaxID=27350 RepID=A0A2S4V4T7_9BASI|nr:hypothetical protein Pst134EA_015389 [Puccinia striiformis f. sp. tritici]KAH9463306.1 hypothetical protein Pst134EA_015389 [Puccinia striiformis f. sp. tritici]KAI7949719.1 hypothetical protein MJO28_008540 [Puccinia striiformis f. sp. tritici]KAI9604641.1 hypothetical protein KEM48_002396 [Puccinia striiformis f. sp. tritici PST-130]POW04534.1 hypothetical protein PSTT_10284 [Puccinia striiformis]